MSELDRDLGAWAREELSREQLLAVHGAAAAAVVAVHDRLTGAAAAVTVPSVEAGWAALLARIDAPAPVVPLRRPRPRRTLSIAVAAALALAGIAYAASRGSHDGSPAVSPATTGPAVAGPFSGSHGRRSAPGPTARTAPPSGSVRPSGSGPSARGGGATPGIDSGTGGGSAKPGDDPHDRDQGTGNDGSHNDHGSGNNGPEGSPPPESHGR
jgi:hypothetical protein